VRAPLIDLVQARLNPAHSLQSEINGVGRVGHERCRPSMIGADWLSRAHVQAHVHAA
jgi:hypothetical protein